MYDLKYKCLRCGQCCFEIKDSPEIKRIPLYPEEVDKLIKIAEKKLIQEFKVIEDLVFPDSKNKKILVITYRIFLDNTKSHCPFYLQEKGCLWILSLYLY